MDLEYRILTSLEKVFCSPYLKPEVPLITDQTPTFEGARGETISFQIAFKCSHTIKLSLEAESPLKHLMTIREVRNVPCDIPMLPGYDQVLREDPGLYPDPLVPLDRPLSLVAGMWQAIWVTVTIPVDCQPSSYPFTFHFKRFQHPGCPHQSPETVQGQCAVILQVHPAVLPEQTLICTNWFYTDCLSVFYQEEPWTERFWQILEHYIRDYAAHGRNMLLTPLWTVTLDVNIGAERPTTQLLEIEYRDGHYQFDFSRLKRWIDLAKDCGISYFEMSHFFTQWGAKACPKIMVRENGELIRRFGWDVAADSPDYRQFLSELLAALLPFLRQEGLAQKCYFHISDEPVEEVIEAYKRASEPIREMLDDDEFPVIDALSSVKYVQEGLIKRPACFTTEADDFAKLDIPHRWCYFCGTFRGFPARSFGVPSYCYRILGVLLYLYRMEGFLHWGHNFWFTQYSVDTDLNPWQDTTAGHSFCGGNIYNVYPAKDGTPVAAIHYEVFAEAMQDLRLIQLLDKKIGRDACVALICDGLNYQPTMNHFPRTAGWLLDLRSRIFAALEDK